MPGLPYGNGSHDRAVDSGAGMKGVAGTVRENGEGGKKLMTTVYADPYQYARLIRISERTKIPSSHLIREGIDLLLMREGFFSDEGLESCRGGVAE